MEPEPGRSPHGAPPGEASGHPGRPGHPESSHYTGTTDGASGPYTADGGHVIISNRAGDLDASSFYGGHADSKGDVTGNRVEMRDGTSRAANIYGGFTENGRASGNTVTVENGRIGGTWAGGRVYAGYSQAGDVHKNVLEIRDGHIEGSHTEVSAGYTKNGDSTGNSLTISGGGIRRTDAYHFVSAGFSREGNALGNTLTVTSLPTASPLALYPPDREFTAAVPPKLILLPSAFWELLLAIKLP